eukprot:gnl/TRDRNA2_/TRDRNA2_179889_c0_seq1.p1 gnl/TRDRNA2_/TRDRNA2_179889_c0~~gnl/TRDRNA2_/TRDRNA2_179889_c0_seq1.p1  ORF type:complete len:623 (-),score=111.98 gnl/TRDRNA2_/TRDRNA2_179889_c0_seq1:73-1941(-)
MMAVGSCRLSLLLLLTALPLDVLSAAGGPGLRLAQRSGFLSEEEARAMALPQTGGRAAAAIARVEASDSRSRDGSLVLPWLRFVSQSDSVPTLAAIAMAGILLVVVCFWMFVLRPQSPWKLFMQDKPNMEARPAFLPWHGVHVKKTTAGLPQHVDIVLASVVQPLLSVLIAASALEACTGVVWQLHKALVFVDGPQAALSDGPFFGSLDRGRILDIVIACAMGVTAASILASTSASGPETKKAERPSSASSSGLSAFAGTLDEEEPSSLAGVVAAVLFPFLALLVLGIIFGGSMLAMAARKTGLSGPPDMSPPGHVSLAHTGTVATYPHEASPDEAVVLCALILAILVVFAVGTWAFLFRDDTPDEATWESARSAIGARRQASPSHVPLMSRPSLPQWGPSRPPTAQKELPPLPALQLGQAVPLPAEDDILDSELVVREHGGKRVVISGQLGPYPQEELIKVLNMDTNAIEANVFVLEEGPEPSVHLETGSRDFVAMLDTSAAVYRSPEEAMAERFVTIRRARGGQEGPIFARIHTEEQGGNLRCVVTRIGADQRSCLRTLLVLHYDQDQHFLRAASASGEVLAQPETVQLQANGEVRVLWLRQGADFGLVISSVVAARKLM